jgi:hypothetical protein
MAATKGSYSQFFYRRELGVSAGHEGGGFLVPDMNEPYPFFLLAESLEDSVDAIAGQAEYRVDTPCEEPFHEYIRCVAHLCLQRMNVLCGWTLA